MKLSAQELDALCEYVDGRREAGAGYDAIADTLQAYTVPRKAGEAPLLTEEDLDNLEPLHRKWKQRQVYLEKQRVAGDSRSGTQVPEVKVDWRLAADGYLNLKAAPPAEPTIFERADALRAVMYLKRSLLRAKTRWVTCKTITLRPGMEWEEHRGPGKIVKADGTEAQWLWGCVVVKQGGAVKLVMEECRKRALRPVGWHGHKHPALELERRELHGERIDVKDISARLATLLHTCLGGDKSPFRNNEHLAQLLGVTREAMRVRKKRIMQDAGLRSAEGLVPNRANGGRVAQERRKAG